MFNITISVVTMYITNSISHRLRVYIQSRLLESCVCHRAFEQYTGCRKFQFQSYSSLYFFKLLKRFEVFYVTTR